MQKTDLILDNVDVVKLDATIWSARKKLRAEDLILADGSKLPPDELASLGSMRLVDRERIGIFDTLKKEAERNLLKVGVRFLGGFAVPTAMTAGLISELDLIQARFDRHKAEFMACYADAVNEWVGRYPDFAQAIRRAVDTPDSVSGKLRFDYVVFRVSKADSVASLDRATEGMGHSLFREVAQEATALLEKSLLGRNQITRNVLRPIRRMRDKLDGLGFLDHRVHPVVDTIDRLLASISATGQLDEEAFNRIFSVTMLLSDPDKMRRHGEGLLDLQGPTMTAMPDLAAFGAGDTKGDDENPKEEPDWPELPDFVEEGVAREAAMDGPIPEDVGGQARQATEALVSQARSLFEGLELISEAEAPQATSAESGINEAEDVDPGQLVLAGDFYF